MWRRRSLQPQYTVCTFSYCTKYIYYVIYICITQCACIYIIWVIYNIYFLLHWYTYVSCMYIYIHIERGMHVWMRLHALPPPLSFDVWQIGFLRRWATTLNEHDWHSVRNAHTFSHPTTVLTIVSHLLLVCCSLLLVLRASYACNCTRSLFYALCNSGSYEGARSGTCVPSAARPLAGGKMSGFRWFLRARGVAKELE